MQRPAPDGDAAELLHDEVDDRARVQDADRDARLRQERAAGRPLRRYRRRWKVERLFAWLQNFRRLVVRYERFAENFLGMLHLACCLILLRGL